MTERLIAIATEVYSRALLLQSFLSSNGIECSLQNENLIQPTVGEGVKVLIRENDVEKAMKLIAKHRPSKRKIQTIGKILVPIDFSEVSLNAAKFAIKLANKYKAEVKLLHVYHLPTIDMIPFSDIGSIQIDFDYSGQILQKETKERLRKAFADLKSYAVKENLNDVQLGYSLQEGFTAFGIVEMTKQYKPSIIIMGTRNNGFESIELVGSVAAEVAEDVTVPILVIPEKADFTRLSDIKKIIYAAHLDDKDAFSIRKLAVLMSAFSVSIKCIYASDSENNAVNKAKMNQLKEYLDTVIKTTDIDYEILQCDKASTTFQDYIQNQKIDLFAINMRKRTIWSRIFNLSLSRQMLAKADVPILIFPS
ncbi:MAG: universal stress protein [Salinivirgaceae bacterium]|nr:universal stress protein [Salinivirgaceae bacterium]MDY0280725.1 universal stress protein [Salinivirgaceae bacterium]